MNLVVKVPDDLRERLCSFPFLQTLVKELKKEIEARNKGLSEEEAEVLNVHLICLKEGLEALNLLPFKAFYHEVGPEDLKTIFTAHRAVKNMKIERTDTFISLSESFVDASLGKALGATDRVGFNIGKNSLLLNKKSSLLKGRHLTERLHQMLSLALSKTPEKLPDTPQSGYCRHLDSLWDDWNEAPYTVINLPIKSMHVREQYSELFDLIEEEKFVFLTEGEENVLLLKDWARTLPKKNEYIIFEVNDLIKFSKLVAHTQLFISEDSALVNIAAYCGAHIFYLRENDPIKVSGPLYFLGDVRYFDLNEPQYKESGETAYSKIFDEVLSFLGRIRNERESNKQ